MVGDVLIGTGQWKLLKEMLAATHAWITSHLIAWSRAKYYYEQLTINSTSEAGDSSSDGGDEVASEEKEEEEDDTEEVEGWESGPLDWRLQAVRSII